MSDVFVGGHRKKLEEMLCCKRVATANEETRAYFKDKCVLVTGGGGTIGSELCRCLMECEAGQIVIFDVYENSAYELLQELSFKYPRCASRVFVEIGSVQSRERVESLFEKYSIDTVFHAAAYKHVPLMETSPGEAVKNNVLGTENVADASERHGVSKFVLVSTDKAVNPTSVMGATKRLCEMDIYSRTSKTVFSAVRFGNVLGSHGSVVPIFERQILEGGPVTITDKRMTRYFMSVSEACLLVMEAAVMAEGGELFVLDMGESINMLDFAKGLITAMGYKPYEEIDIKEIGMRPGEKLYEEILTSAKELLPTKNEMIFVQKGNRFDGKALKKSKERLKASLEGDRDGIVKALKDCIPEYN